MDHLTPSSREADSGLIMEELANISQPSSPQSFPRAGISVPSSNSSELDRASGTLDLDNIPRDEDGESITIVDEDYDAHSETSSIFSLRTFKSLFDQVDSSTRESLDSFLPMVFAPSFQTRNVNIRQLAQYLQSNRRLSDTVILDMTTYQVPTLIKHTFVVLRVKQGHLEGWLRLDRRAEDISSVSYLFSGMRGPAKDASDSVNFQSRIYFKEPPSLKALESLLIAIYEESKDYDMWTVRTASASSGPIFTSLGK